MREHSVMNSKIKRAACITAAVATLFLTHSARYAISQSIFRQMKLEQNGVQYRFQINDFYSNNARLDALVEEILSMLTEREKVSQLVISSVGKRGRTPKQVEMLLSQNSLGGVLFLENPKEDIKNLGWRFTQLAEERYHLLPFFIIDGEPSLIHTRVIGAEPFPPAGSIKNEKECREVAQNISLLLNELNIHINYAPVCDVSINREVIGSRSFGNDERRIWTLARTFIDTMQENGIVSTVKHFPGQGSVQGDTHSDPILIEELPPELSVFKRSIDAGVISVMVGHVGIKGESEEFGKIDTEGRPATLSRHVVTDILKEKLGFKGIVVTDAMNMDSVMMYDMPSVEAIRAGCDMILMPNDELEFIENLLKEIERNNALNLQVMESVRKIVRLKVCLGLVNEISLVSLDL
jgi:beta-N-acetylhexosaminidase